MANDKTGFLKKFKNKLGLSQSTKPELGPIHAVISDVQVRIVYQPIVDVESNQIFGYEALVRSLSASYSDPGALFAAAIAAGRCGELGRLLRRLAVEGCPDFNLFLNIVPHEFDEGYLVRPDDPIFLHEQQVYLEITESVPLSQFARYKSVLNEIRSKGIYLAVDDLGAGYSNLKYISDLNPDFVKLDRDLITGIENDERQYRLVESIVQLCRTMRVQVIAEGIETYAELAAVRKSGVRYCQGYLLARPNSPPPGIDINLTL